MCFPVMKSLDFVVLLAALWLVSHQSTAKVERRVGIQLLSYAIEDGKLPDGSCCDGLTSGTGCQPDSCDTVFVFCLRSSANNSSCVANVETLPLVNNNTVSQFGKYIDSNSKTALSLFVLPVTTMVDLQMEIDVVEVTTPGDSSTGIAMGKFFVPINYTNMYTAHPDWDTYSFHSNAISLELNVTSFCAKYWYKPNCDIYCKPMHSSTYGYYTCGPSGNKVCVAGATGTDCKTVIDLCVSAPCSNGATCNKMLNNFTCTCSPGFTGKLCDVMIKTTAPMTTSTGTPPTTTSNVMIKTTAPMTTTSTGTPPTTTSKKAGESGGMTIAVVLGPLAGLAVIGVLTVVGYKLWTGKKGTNVRPKMLEEKRDSEQKVGNKARDEPDMVGRPRHVGPHHSAIPPRPPVVVEW